jgi:phage terminase large subunit-like protein
LTPVPLADQERGDGDQVIEALEALCIITKDGFAGKASDPLRLRPWQKTLMRYAFARRPDGRRRHRTLLIGEPRKNGKSALGSGVALDGLLFDGRGAEVYSAAAEKEQGRIVFGETGKMIKASPDLADVCNVMKDVIEVPATDSIYRVLSAEAYSKEGLNISRAIVDELHAHATDDLWNVLTLASAARLDPMVWAITTAGVMMGRDGRDSICYRLFKYGRDIAEGLVDDPSFFMAWWGAPDGADHLDPKVWEAANPGFGDLIDPEDFASAVLRTPENEFRTKRLNQWVATATAWLPAGAWEACNVGDRSIPNGATVYLGFDGSRNNDSTALVAVQPGDPPFVDVVAVWERPAGVGDDWEVPVEQVENQIRLACRRWQVKEVLCDPYMWVRSIQILAAEGLPMLEFPQTPERMIPATQRFYEAVLTRQIAHNGNEILARHLRSAVTKPGEKGYRIVKESKGSARKIDAALAAVLAFSECATAKTGARAAREWLEGMAPPCKSCGHPNLPGVAVCSKCSQPVTGPLDATPAPAPSTPDPEPEAEAKWTPWGSSPSRPMPDQTRAALNMLRNLPGGHRF